MPAEKYLRFALLHRRFVGFGFLVAFASSFGQTYFIGVFGLSIEKEFALSHTEWATIYLCGTLASALVLPYTGKLIDRHALRGYTLATLLLLIAGTLLMSALQGVVLLVLAVFLLRQAGQGLMSHIAITSMARYYDAGRGRAIALATLGFAAGESALPVLALIVMAWVGWQASFLVVAALLAFVLLPALMWLLRGHDVRHAEHLLQLERASRSEEEPLRSWTRREVLGDLRFYLLLPGVLAPAMVITALFFHHLSLADAKSWSHGWITGSYVIYGGATTVVALVCGPLIDKLGGMRLVPAMLLPMALGLVVVSTLSEPWAVWPYFILLGISIGISHTAVAAMWAELYGVGSIGAIKSLVSALAVLASALGPLIAGALMDRGVSIETVCLYFAVYAVAASMLLLVGTRLRPQALAVR